MTTYTQEQMDAIIQEITTAAANAAAEYVTNPPAHEPSIWDEFVAPGDDIKLSVMRAAHEAGRKAMDAARRTDMEVPYWATL